MSAAASRVRSPAAKKQTTSPVSLAQSTAPPRGAAAQAASPEPASLKTLLQVWWTVGFAVFTFLMQCFVVPKQNWSWPPKFDLSLKQAHWVVSSPWVWLCWTPLIVALVLLRRFFNKHRPTAVDQSMMVWWCTNFFFFHTHCDLLSGYWQVMPALTEIYAQLSPGHNQPQWADARLHLDTTYFLELTVEVPLAFFCLYLYLRRHPARYVVETFAVAVQAAGTVIYYVPPLIKREATSSWVCYFDRCFGAVWIVFPLIVLRRHFMAASTEKKKD